MPDNQQDNQLPPPPDEGSSSLTQEDEEEIGRDLDDQRRRQWFVSGFYPINRNPVQLSYGSNDVVRLSVTFNVDKISLVGVTSTFS